MIESNSIRSLGWIILPVRFAPLISVVSRVKLLIQPDIGHSSQKKTDSGDITIQPKIRMAWCYPVFPCVSPALISMNATNKSHLDNSHRIHENWVHLPSNFPSKKWSIHAQKPYHICTWIHGSVNGGCLIQVDRADPKSRAVGSSGGPDIYVNMSHRIHVWDI